MSRHHRRGRILHHHLHRRLCGEPRCIAHRHHHIISARCPQRSGSRRLRLGENSHVVRSSHQRRQVRQRRSRIIPRVHGLQQRDESDRRRRSVHHVHDAGGGTRQSTAVRSAPHHRVGSRHVRDHRVIRNCWCDRTVLQVVCSGIKVGIRNGCFKCQRVCANQRHTWRRAGYDNIVHETSVIIACRHVPKTQASRSSLRDECECVVPPFDICHRGQRRESRIKQRSGACPADLHINSCSRRSEIRRPSVKRQSVCDARYRGEVLKDSCVNAASAQIQVIATVLCRIKRLVHRISDVR